MNIKKKSNKHAYDSIVFPVFILLMILARAGIAAASLQSALRFQGVWELAEYHSFAAETNRTAKQKWGGMGGTPYIAFSADHVCPWGTITAGDSPLPDPCETGFFPFKIEKDLITVERQNKPPLKWRFSLKNKTLEISDLSMSPVYGTPEQKLKFIV